MFIFSFQEWLSSHITTRRSHSFSASQETAYCERKNSFWYDRCSGLSATKETPAGHLICPPANKPGCMTSLESEFMPHYLLPTFISFLGINKILNRLPVYTPTIPATLNISVSLCGAPNVFTVAHQNFHLAAPQTPMCHFSLTVHYLRRHGIYIVS